MRQQRCKMCTVRKCSNVQRILLCSSCLWCSLTLKKLCSAVVPDYGKLQNAWWCQASISSEKFCLRWAIFCTVISVLHSTFESWIWKFVYLIRSALKVGIGHDLRSACVCQKLKTRTEMQRSSCIYASQTAHYLFQEHTCPTELRESIMQSPKLLHYNPESCDGNICIHWWWYKRNAYNGGPARRGRRLA